MANVDVILWHTGELTDEVLLPTLLLVGAEADPPELTDPLVDWIRLPASTADIDARCATLERRVKIRGEVRVVDGLLHSPTGTVPLTPLEQRITEALLAARGRVVHRQQLMSAVWPETGFGDRGRLDAAIRRLRVQLSTVGLSIRTVRGRGYLLENGNLSDSRQEVAAQP